MPMTRNSPPRNSSVRMNKAYTPILSIGLLKGKQTRSRLLDGLIKMYKDQGVDGYYDTSLLSNYGTRYNLFILVVVFIGLIAIVVPFISK